jgi:hypothetical protein
MDKKDLVAVIVLNHNKKNDLLECLESVYKQDYKKYEVIVVDNASTDGSVEAVSSKYSKVFLVKNKLNSGAGAGRNAGWNFVEKNFDYKYLLFLDNDVIIDKTYITQLIAIFNNNPQVGIACGKAYTDNKLNIIMSAGIRTNLFNGSIYDIGSGKKDKGQYNQSGYVDACGSFAMMVRKELFSALGGFDENFTPYGWEDVNLCVKAKRYSFFTYYASEAKLIHKGTKLGRKPNPLYEKSKIKNYIYFLRTNTTLIQKITCAACLPFRAMMLALRLVLTGNSRIVLEHFKGFFTGIRNINQSIKLNKYSLSDADGKK